MRWRLRLYCHNGANRLHARCFGIADYREFSHNHCIFAYHCQTAGLPDAQTAASAEALTAAILRMPEQVADHRPDCAA
ncbi:hypothetical protein ABIB60_003344 [Hymenobacter sp. UYP22]